MFCHYIVVYPWNYMMMQFCEKHPHCVQLSNSLSVKAALFASAGFSGLHRPNAVPCLAGNNKWCIIVIIQSMIDYYGNAVWMRADRIAAHTSDYINWHVSGINNTWWMEFECMWLWSIITDGMSINFRGPLLSWSFIWNQNRHWLQ